MYGRYVRQLYKENDNSVTSLDYYEDHLMNAQLACKKVFHKLEMPFYYSQKKK